MSVTRRVALKVLAAGAAVPLHAGRARGEEAGKAVRAGKAILCDSTRCIGCRECVIGCAEANGWEAEEAFGSELGLADTCLTFVERHPLADGDCYRKVQCMHCVEPACVSACMLGAMHKDEDGAVVWQADLCVGCRYCEIACPFNVPRFEWDTPVPALHKCQMCPELRAEGRTPACVEQCHRGALMYGAREEMLAEAHRRIDAAPDAYNAHVYGEREGGGTSVLYLARAGVSFADVGFPALSEEPVAAVAETVQHTVYRGFAAPLALFALLGAVVRRNVKSVRAEEAAHHSTERALAVGGRLITPSVIVLGILAALGFASIVWRFVAGLGATTNLNDGYPMGLWIAFDVVTGTALACGGYAMALLVYVANRGRYHPLVRPALVTSAFGYTLGGLSVLVDIGRPWNVYKMPFFFWEWNLSSILLEVALCIMLYTVVLWIEVSPIFFERWQDSRRTALRKIALAVSPRLEKALPWAIALGLLLPTMHQSSLGSLMLVAGSKLHPLWNTPLLPVLFLISCVAMGYAAVTLESNLSARAFNRPVETPMLRGLALPVALTLAGYAVIRVTDLVLRGRLGLVTRMDGFSLLFLTEMALFLAPAIGLLLGARTAKAGYLTAIAVLVMLGGGLYRFSTFLFAFDPGDQWSYFPALPEFAVTVGFIAAEILGYLLLIKRFPILRGTLAELRRASPQGPTFAEPDGQAVTTGAAFVGGDGHPEWPDHDGPDSPKELVHAHSES